MKASAWATVTLMSHSVMKLDLTATSEVKTHRAVQLFKNVTLNHIWLTSVQ